MYIFGAERARTLLHLRRDRARRERCEVVDDIDRQVWLPVRDELERLGAVGSSADQFHLITRDPNSEFCIQRRGGEGTRSAPAGEGRSALRDEDLLFLAGDEVLLKDLLRTRQVPRQSCASLSERIWDANQE